MRYSRQRGHDGRPIPLNDAAGFAAMRRAGRLAAETLDHVAAHVRPGVTTAWLDQLCDSFIRHHGAVPATVGYKGYRHASCISVNHVVTHGIPADHVVLADGDIVNVDVTPLVDGWHGDTSRTFLVGTPRETARRLVEAAHAALWAGIDAVRPGATLGDVGWAIERTARTRGFSVVKEFCGHGVGRVFHDAPEVLNIGQPGKGAVLEPGMIFTVEPMLNAGRAEVCIMPDGWTTVTRDRSWSAQFEHTVGVTESGVEVFTRSPRGLDGPFG